MTSLAPAFQALKGVQPLRVVGTVAALRGLTLVVDDLPLPVGSLVSIIPAHAAAVIGGERALGEIVGFTGGQALVMMLGQTTGISPGDRVAGEQVTQTVGVGESMLGRVIDGLGRPLDQKPAMRDTVQRAICPDPIRPMQRRRITDKLQTGVRSVDLMTTLGRGQRMGIFAGPGVGKSTLLGTMVKRSNADVCVVALIGERGREVKDFIEHSLGPEGMARSVVVAATSDESPNMRLRASRVACTVAEYFRDQGKDVLLVMDSVTRFAHAQRQIGLSVGEPPATKGYTPSVFANLAVMLERAGSTEKSATTPAGSITGLYTILVEGDDMTEPIADAARGILDGHIMLSRKLVQKAHYPAVDVLDSISRIADDVCDGEQIKARQQISRLLALYREIEDLVQIGAYAKGSSPEHDVAIEFNGAIMQLLRQGKGDATPFDQSRAELLKIAAASGEMLDKLKRGKQK